MIHKIIPWLVMISSFGLTGLMASSVHWSTAGIPDFIALFMMILGSSVLSTCYFKIYAIFERMCDK